MVSYRSTGDIALANVRKALAAKGIILGRQSQSLSTDEVQVYNIPMHARPLTLEAPQSRHGYKDASLVYDLGVLTARISRVTEGRVILSPTEGAFAVIDFVPRGEPHLYAAPGIEEWLGDPVPDDQRSEVQAALFSEPFAGRFAQFSRQYQAGYVSILRGKS